MYCPNCGKEANEQNKFCARCGTPLRTEAEHPKDKKKTAGKIILRCVLTTLAVVLAVLGLRVWANNIENNEVTPEHLNHLVHEIQEQADAVESYIEQSFSEENIDYSIDEAAKHATDLEVAENQLLRDHWDVESLYYDYTNRRGWDSYAFRNYEALHYAYLNLYRFYDSYHSTDQESARATYEFLLNAYEDCYKKVS